MLIQGKLISPGGDLTEALQIRHKVFVEEQGIPEEIEFDGIDKQSIHVVVYEEDPEWNNRRINANKVPVATGRITFDGTTCEIGHIAVLGNYRGMKYGDFTVRMLLNKAFTSGISTVAVNTPILTEIFFGKIGFKSSGEYVCILGNKYCNMLIQAQDVVTECNKCKKL